MLKNYVHRAWRKQIKLLRKIINGRYLAKKDVFTLIDVFNNNLFSYFKGFDAKHLLKLSDYLSEMKEIVDEKYKPAIVLRPDKKKVKRKGFRI